MSIKSEITAAVTELCEISKLKPGQILVVGCSSSEVRGRKIGSGSDPSLGAEIVDAVLEVLSPRGIYLAAQCCEHLNRAIVIERAALPEGAETVNAIPQPKAGGSFASAAYAAFEAPAVVEEICADAGLDIGGTLIGMHLKKVAVPVRLGNRKIGEAAITAARTRPKFIGGDRAVYDESMK